MPSTETSLTSDVVMRMANAYLAQRATSTQHLRHILERKIRRWFQRRDVPLADEQDLTAMLDDVVARLSRAGVLDDSVFAASRARRLVAKGLPAWRVRRELEEHGLDLTENHLADVLAPDAEAQARRYAERKRLGPFRSGERAPNRDKDVRALIRAGFPARLAMSIVDEGDARIDDFSGPRTGLGDG
jgi:regulatory protein